MAIDLDKLFEQLDRGMDQLDRRFDKFDERMGRMSERLDRRLSKLDLDVELEKLKKKGWDVKKKVTISRDGKKKTTVTAAEKSFNYGMWLRPILVFLIALCFFMVVFNTIFKDDDRKIQTEKRPPAIEETVNKGDNKKL